MKKWLILLVAVSGLVFSGCGKKLKPTNVSTPEIKGVFVHKENNTMWQDDEATKTVRKQWVIMGNLDRSKLSELMSSRGVLEANKWMDTKLMDTSGDTATTYCNNLNLGSYNDWRLPSKDELKGLYSKKDKLKNLSSGPYWSSTTHEGSIYHAWIVNFYNGRVDGDSKNFGNYVRCVRAGQ